MLRESSPKEIMRSKFNISEFRDKLKNSTKVGHPSLKFFTPWSLLFYNESKVFFGLYDETTFSLTSNLKIAQSLFKIKGNYRVHGGKLEIKYEVLPRFKYQYHFWTLCMIYGLGVIIYINATQFDKINGNDLMIVNIFFILLSGFGFLMILRGKKKLEKKFLQIFEIS